jgi:hypothetical protein
LKGAAVHEAAIPAAAQRDPDSREMLRAWIAERGLHCTIHVGMWEGQKAEFREEKAWGVLLSDVVRHIANAMQERFGDSVEKTQAEIVRSLLEELEMPTSEAKGKFLAQ